MTESLKKFLEFMSTQDEATNEKVSKMGKDELIAYAAEAGFTLTPADLEEAEPEGELDLDDADAVAGSESGEIQIAQDMVAGVSKYANCVLPEAELVSALSEVAEPHVKTVMLHHVPAYFTDRVRDHPEPLMAMI